METNQFAHAMKAAAERRGADIRGPCEKVAAFAFRKGWCSLIEMAAAPVLSALRVFADDFAAAGR
jgi:hypothetical protein